MAKIYRYDGNVKAFGSGSTGNNRTVFGGLLQSNTLNDNINANFLTGWEIVGPTEVPSKQDFNAMGYTLGQLIAYIFQHGVCEYNSSQEFNTGSFCSYSGSLYRSLTDSNTGNTPSSSPSNWEVMVSSSDLDEYYTSAQLDAGQLDNRYYTETELDAGQLDNRYYTETELDSGQLDNRYYTESEMDVELAGKSNIGHAHDASAITSGTIDIARLPNGALERLISVADQTARYALTTNEVQLGDSVRQIDTGVMYIVIDEANLGNSAGYQEYTAGSATSVPWSGITSKPANLLYGDLGTTDNAILRADGTGQYTAQGSSPTIDDSGNIDTGGTVSASQFISDVATGTAPLTVASTTVVTNLNADMVDGVQGSNLAKIDTYNTFTASQGITSSSPLLLITDTFDNHYTKISRYNGNSYMQYHGNFYLQGEGGAPAGGLYLNDGVDNRLFYHTGNDSNLAKLDGTQSFTGTNSFASGGVEIAVSSGAKIYSGAGSPESAITASPGSLYLNTSGGANTTLYVKESGTGNTGWIAK